MIRLLVSIILTAVWDVLYCGIKALSFRRVMKVSVVMIMGSPVYRVYKQPELSCGAASGCLPEE